MVSEVIEAPVETPVDPAVPEVQETENPAPVEAEVAAPATTDEPAATEVPQVEVSEAPKPEYMTREDWEREKAEVKAQAAAEALETDRKRRQTENARKAKAEADEREAIEEAVDVVRVVTADPDYNPNDPSQQVVKAIDRLAKKKAERLTAGTADLVDQAFGYIVAPITGEDVEFDDSFRAVGQKLAPKVQAFIEKMRPLVEAEARKGYVLESDMDKRVEAAVAKRLAQSRDGEEPLVRTPGAPSNVNKNSIEYWEGRVAHEGEDGVPDMTGADWQTYKNLRRQHGLS